VGVIDEVLAQMEELVASGEWPVGSRIPPEPELVAVLGVGRNSVREAVRALSHAGVLEARQGDGTYVRSAAGLGAALERYVSRADARHVLEARRALEREAARLAARRRTDDDVAGLDALVADQRRAAAAHDRDAFVRGDVAFHRAVATAARNPVLLDLLDHLGPGLPELIGRAVDADVDADRGFAVHDELAAAIRAADPDAAERACDDLFDRILDLAGDHPGPGRPR
jgi:DNA-binding FadR family transcriptional regulator